MPSSTDDLRRRFAGMLLSGRYRLNDIIGRGGMGAVFRALDERLDRMVAVKVIWTGELADVDVAPHRQRFIREARLAARIQHPNVVTIHDFGTDVEPGTGKELDFIVMELLRGESLAEWIPRLSRSDLSVSLSLLLQAADGVAAGHAQGVVHRDVKPRNVIVSPGANPDHPVARVVDFGIAKPLHDDGAFGQITVGPGFLGTATYASPEQLQGRIDVDPASDVFSLAVVAYEALTGAPPFTEAERTRLSQRLFVEPRAPRRLNPAIPPEVEEVLLQALELDPSARFRDAGHLASALKVAWMPVGIEPRPAPDGGTVEMLVPNTGTHPLEPAATVPVPESAVTWQLAATPVPEPVQEGVSAPGPASLPEAPAAAEAASAPAAAPPRDAVPPGSPPVQDRFAATSIGVQGGAAVADPVLPSERRTGGQPAARPPADLGRMPRAGAWLLATALVVAALAAVAQSTGVTAGVGITGLLGWNAPQDLALGESFPGVLGRRDRRDDDGSRYDEYRFQADRSGPLTAEVHAAGFEVAVEWGRMVNGRWHLLESSGSGPDQQISVAADDAGEYRLRVQGQYPDALGDYTVRVLPGIPEMRVGQPVFSIVSPADARLPEGGRVEHWRFHGFTGQQVTLTMRGIGRGRVEWGRMAAGEWTLLEAGAMGDTVLTSTMRDTGEYMVRIRSPEESTAQRYSLIAESGAREIPLGGWTMTGAVSAADAGAETSPYERWRFRGTSGQPVTLTMRRSNGGNPYLEVGRTVAGQWRAMETNDDFDSLGNAQITVTADSGEYLVRAGMRSLSGTARYTLEATTSLRRIGVGQVRTSTLSGADYDNKDGWYYEAWAYRGSPGQRITVTLRCAVPAGTPYYVALGRPENGRMNRYAGVHAVPSSLQFGSIISKEAVLKLYIADDREYQILIYSTRAAQSRYTLSVAPTPPEIRFVP